MTTAQKEKVARRKLSLLELAQELGNVSKACKIMGYSRQQFYEIRRNYQTFGANGLIDRLPGPKGPHANRMSDEVEKAILEHCLKHPTRGAQRIADELLLEGVQVSSGGVRGVGSRNGLTTKIDRLLRLEEASRKRRLTLTEEQIQALERFDPEFRERHIEVHFPGDLVAVDTFFVGTLKGVGKVYLQARPRPLQPLRLGPALHEQAAPHRGPGAQQRCPALLRSSCRPSEDRPQRQRP